MKKRSGAVRFIRTALIFMIASASILHASDPAESGKDRGYPPGEILVRLRGDIPLPRILSIPQILQVIPSGISGIRVSPSRDDIFLLRLGIRPVETENRIMDLLRAHPAVTAVSPNFRRRPTRRPGDPLYKHQWNLHNTGENAPITPGNPGADISVENAWDSGTGTPGIVVAVVDSGIDYTHPDLAPNMWRNPFEEPDNGYDDDGNGYVDDVHGFDFAGDRMGVNDPDPMDEDGHGTHVAGIIGARGNNGIGISGINWNCGLLAIGAARPDGFHYLDDEVEAFEYIRRLKLSGTANIVAVNCSFGGSQYSEVEEQAIRELTQAGITLVAAAGNGGDDDIGDNNDETPFYPASYPVDGVVSVAATGSGDQLTDFSNFGASEVDIAAPGDGIFSTVIRGQGRMAQVQSEGRVWNALSLEFSGATEGISGFLIPCRQGLTEADFPPAVNGAVALVERGVTEFSEKVRLAAKAGATAVVIYNHEPGNFNGTLQDSGDWLPAVSVSRKDGLEMLGWHSIPVTLINRPGDYDYKSGTSMATPHVSAALALMASLHPEEAVSRRVARLLISGKPLIQLVDRVATGSRLDLGGLTIPPPLSVQAHRTRNGSLLQSEYITRISWSANPASGPHSVTGYLVFLSRPGFRIIGQVGADKNEYLHRRVSRDTILEYGVVSVDAEGKRGSPAFAIIEDK